jgi:hypothetical protein
LPRLRRVADDHSTRPSVLPGQSRAGAVMATVRIPPTLRQETDGPVTSSPTPATSRRSPTSPSASRLSAACATWTASWRQFINVYVERRGRQDTRTGSTRTCPRQHVILLPPPAGGDGDARASVLDSSGRRRSSSFRCSLRSRPSVSTRSSKDRIRPARSRTASPRR